MANKISLSRYNQICEDLVLTEFLPREISLAECFMPDLGDVCLGNVQGNLSDILTGCQLISIFSPGPHFYHDHITFKYSRENASDASCLEGKC